MRVSHRFDEYHPKGLMVFKQKRNKKKVLIHKLCKGLLYHVEFGHIKCLTCGRMFSTLFPTDINEFSEFIWLSNKEIEEMLIAYEL